MLKRAAKPLDTLSVLNAIPGRHLILLPDAPAFTIAGATDAYLAATFAKREEIIGRSCFEVFPENPLDAEASGVQNIRASLHYVLEDKRAHRMADQRHDILNPETGQFELRVRSPLNKPVLDENGAVLYIIHSVEDVTEKIRLQEAERTAHEKLAQSKKNLRNTILQAPVAICILRGENLVIEEANDRMFEFWGKSSEEVMHKPLFEAIPEAKNQGYEELMAKVLQTGEPFSASELPVTLPRNGKVETVYINFTYEPIREADTSISGIIAVATDVTEQVTARKKKEESEVELKQFKFMADHAQDPFILMSEDATFAYLNKKALEAWGYTEEEAEYIRVPDVDPIYQEEKFAEVFARARQEIIPQFETLHKRKDGHIYPVEVNMGGLNLNGKSYMFAVARDITERKKAEEALIDKDRNFRAIIDRAPVAMRVFRGEDMIFETINQSMLELLGKTAGITGKPLLDVLPEIKGQPIFDVLYSVFRTGEPYYGYEWLVPLMRNGVMEERYFNFAYTAVVENGKIAGVMEVATEVTEQVLARKKVEESEERFRNLVNSVSQLAWMTDAEGWIYWYNQRWYDYTGTTLEEMQGWGWEKVHHPDHLERVVTFVKEAWQKEESWELTFPLRSKDGNYRWFLPFIPRKKYGRKSRSMDWHKYRHQRSETSRSRARRKSPRANPGVGKQE